MFRSVAVVIGCYLLSVVLVLSTDPLLTQIFPGNFVKGRVPSDAPLLASTGCFFVISILCAWICARFGGSPANRSVLWFFVVGEVMGGVFTIVNWGNGWPHWYGLSWLVVWPVGCWIGLMLDRSKASQAAAASA
jgi:hypothetical protein